jgi:hypothetical protein
MIEMSSSNLRTDRYITTYLLFGKAKSILIGKKKDFCRSDSTKYLDEIYNEVFLVRRRDVVAGIRGLSILFITDWICGFELSSGDEYLKYVVCGLDDESETVRKQAVKGIGKILKKSRMYSEEVRDRLLEMAVSDASRRIRRHVMEVIIDTKDPAISSEVLLDVVLRGESTEEEKREIVMSICPGGTINIERMHEIYRCIGGRYFRYIKDIEEVYSGFLRDVLEYTRTVGGDSMLMVLSLVREFRSLVNVPVLIEIFEVSKDQEEHVRGLMESMVGIETYKQNEKVTEEIIYLLGKYVLENPEMQESYAKLLRVLENDFQVAVDKAIDSLKRNQLVSGPGSSRGQSLETKNGCILSLVRRFDISDMMEKEWRSVEKCYCCLWMIGKGEYERIKDIILLDVENHIELGSILLFLVGRIRERYPEWLIDDDERREVLETSYDGYKYLAILIYNHLLRNGCAEREDFVFELANLIPYGIFEDKAVFLFRHGKADLIEETMRLVKNKKKIVSVYFQMIRESGCWRSDVAKILSKSVDKNEPERYVFRCIYEYIKGMEGKTISDGVVSVFLGHLNLNECIVLESISPNGRFRRGCMRRLKMMGRSEGKSEGHGCL